MSFPALIRAGVSTHGRLFSIGLAVALLSIIGTGPDSSPPLHPTARADVTDERSDDVPEIDWRTLRGLDYRTGQRSEELDSLDGRMVKVAGFTVPFEDWMTTATEFLLVPYAGACVHTPPPPPHQLVYVQMDRERRASLAGMQSPMWVEGVLHIEEVDNLYGQAGFRIVARRVYPYRY